MLTASVLVAPPGKLGTERLRMPRCVAPRVAVYLSDRPGQSKQCRHSARFRVGDRDLCMRHAEIAALEHLLGQQPVEPIAHVQV